MSQIQTLMQGIRQHRENIRKLRAALSAEEAELDTMQDQLNSAFDRIATKFAELAAELPTTAQEAEQVPASPSWAPTGAVSAAVRDASWVAVTVPKWLQQAPKPKKENPVTLAIVEVMRDADRPMKPSEIYSALAERAVPIPGKSPRNTLSAYLSNGNPEVFTKTPEGLWTLAAKETA